MRIPQQRPTTHQPSTLLPSLTPFEHRQHHRLALLQHGGTVKVVSKCQQRALEVEVDGFDGNESDSEREPTAVYETVLSLCDYFNCTRLLDRADHNCQLVVDAADNMDDEFYSERGWYAAWLCLLIALRFGLQGAKRAFIPLLAEYSVNCNAHKAEWNSIRSMLDNDTAFELMQASFDVERPDFPYECDCGWFW